MINIYDFNIEKALDDELIEVIFENENIRVERIVSMGQITPESYVYDQKDDEFVTVIKGNAVLYFNDDNKEIKLLEGDSILIKAGCKHQIKYTSSPCVWLCVFYKNKK